MFAEVALRCLLGGQLCNSWRCEHVIGRYMFIFLGWWSDIRFCESRFGRTFCAQTLCIVFGALVKERCWWLQLRCGCIQEGVSLCMCRPANLFASLPCRPCRLCSLLHCLSGVHLIADVLQSFDDVHYWPRCKVQLFAPPLLPRAY